MKEAKIFIAKSGNRCVMTYAEKENRVGIDGNWDREPSVLDLEQCTRWIMRVFNSDPEDTHVAFIPEKESAEAVRKLVEEGDMTPWLGTNLRKQ
jgi:hypothetical protein